MTALLYTDKLIYGSPTRSTTYKVERFQTDSYSIRAAVGINPAQTEYDLQWGGLTQTEMNNLTAQLDSGRGINAFTWTPPGSAFVQKFTVGKYTVNEYAGPTPYYSVNATLTREYDL